MNLAGKNNQSAARWFFIIVAVFVLYTFWNMIQPFMLTLITAGIFAILFSGLDRWLTERVHSHVLSALIIVFGVLLVIFLPIAAIALITVQQATDVLQSGFLGDLSMGVADISSSAFFQALPTSTQQILGSIDVAAIAASAVDWLRQNIGTLLAGGANFLLQLFLFFIFLYYFLIHREAIKEEMFELSPFKDRTDQSIISRISGTVRGVVVGAIIIAFVQALFASIGLTIFGVPKGFLWGSFALIAAQIPMVGVGLIMVPAIIYLIATGATGAAIGLTIWSVTVVGLVDNLLSPLLVGRRTRMPELLVLVSILGGIQLFGPIGFIVGPVVLAGVLVLRDLYRSGVLS